MPTIAEPAFRAPPALPPMNVDARRDGIIADLREVGVPLTPLNVIRRAIDIGIPEHVAAAIAATIEPEMRRAA